MYKKINKNTDERKDESNMMYLIYIIAGLSLLSAYTYYKNDNIDLGRGIYVMVTAFLGTIVGSYCGFLFGQSNPDGL